MIRVANAPCSWGVLEFEGMGESYPYDRVLDEIAATGYIGSELGDWGFMPTESSRLREEFDRRGLSLLGAFVPVFMADASTHDEGIRIAVRTARLLAQASTVSPVIVLADDNGRDAHRTAQAGRIRRDDSLDEARWKTFAAGATAIARAVKDDSAPCSIPTVPGLSRHRGRSMNCSSGRPPTCSACVSTPATCCTAARPTRSRRCAGTATASGTCT